MELNNEFEVDRGIEEAWLVLTDVELIAPCLPGAQLEEIEGDEYRGFVKVKVGPITAQYKGKATFIEKNDAEKRAVLKAEGRDSRGQGNANALITAQLTEVGARRTKVQVNTDLTVTGKVAQFGRGVMADVSEKILRQFVVNLETKVLSQHEPVANAPAAAAKAEPAPEAAAASSSPVPARSSVGVSAASTAGAGAADADAAGGNANGAAVPKPVEAGGVRKIAPTADVEPVDLLEASGASVVKRIVPVLGLVFVLWVLSRLRRGNS